MKATRKLLASVWQWLRRTIERVASARPGLKPYLKEGWVFAYIVLTLLITQLALLVNPQVGIYINAATFLALAGLALWKEPARPLAISAAILPVATMVCLCLPPTTSRFNLLMVYYDTLLLLTLIYRFLFTIEYPVSLTRLKLKGYGLFVPAMLIVGQLLGSLGFLLLKHQYQFSRQLSMVLIVVVVIEFAITEEMLFRGLIQQRGLRLLHPITAAVLSTLLYMIATIGLASGAMVVFALISGAVYSTIYYFKQNLILTITANAMTKLAYLALLGIFIFK